MKCNGVIVREFGFEADGLRDHAEVQEGKGVTAYFLDWPNVLDQSIKKRGDHRVTVTFCDDPPDDLALWLYYLPWLKTRAK